MVLVNEAHELKHAVVRLKSLLLGLSGKFLRLQHDCLLGSKALVQFVCFDLRRYLVGLHPLNHMLIGTLVHQCKVISVLNLFKCLIAAPQIVVLASSILFDC